MKKVKEGKLKEDLQLLQRRPFDITFDIKQLDNLSIY